MTGSMNELVTMLKAQRDTATKLAETFTAAIGEVERLSGYQPTNHNGVDVEPMEETVTKTSKPKRKMSAAARAKIAAAQRARWAKQKKAA